MAGWHGDRRLSSRNSANAGNWRYATLPCRTQVGKRRAKLSPRIAETAKALADLLITDSRLHDRVLDFGMELFQCDMSRLLDNRNWGIFPVRRVHWPF